MTDLIERLEAASGPGSNLQKAQIGQETAMTNTLPLPHWRFRLGDRVTKTKGSSWTGRVVGFYSTSLTPEGYAVESENEPGSVQIYPVGALADAS